MNTERTLIQKYAAAVISGMMGKVKSISGLQHNLTKGELRELLVNEVLSSYLTDQFGIGSGIIVNQAGLQSNQTDIIIYDNRVLPPFLKKQNIGGCGGNLLHSSYKYFDKFGNLRVDKNYLFGIENGNEVQWDSLGNIVLKITYNAGEIIFWRFLDENDNWIEINGPLFKEGTIRKVYKKMVC